MRFLLSLALALLLGQLAPAQDLVAKTDAKTPAEELKCFTLPPGFEAQLVASEPDIQKPMQLAFDAKGRLWVTTSHHYPFAVAEGKGTDKLFVLSDFGDDGKAKKVQVFDDKLNIPIGVLPLPDGKSVIVSECGKILKLTDTDGDGKADKREVLFGGFGFKDTHGMTNSFTLLPDGWVYACHGFANDSKVKGTDGHEISMNSGHTFRFKTDGSRIEIFTRGQVNPFGMCVDPWLNLYTADCHSRPMTQLVRGAYYDSFGKPHDGLGYAPHVINHMHGSTGLCGLVYYAADHFPKEWTDVMFVGNCVTNRINCDKIGWQGATPVGKELPDFLSSSDPWFRPVDIKLGPDGALYVSDFYNKIVGHYEVDLKHPGRDKDRGRVWRIVYTGKKGEKVPPLAFARKDWTQASADELFADFGHPNVAVRLLAANEAAGRANFKPEARTILDDLPNASARVGLMATVRERTGEIKIADYEQAAAFGKQNPDKIKSDSLTGLLVKSLVSRDKWGPEERKLALDWFANFDSIRVKRAVVDGMTAHPDAEFVAPLLKFLPTLAADDLYFRHAAKAALRNCLEQKGGWNEAIKVLPMKAGEKPEGYRHLVEAVLGTTEPQLLFELKVITPLGLVPDDLLFDYGRLIGKRGTPQQWGALAGSICDSPYSMRSAGAVRGLLGIIRGIQESGRKLEPRDLSELMWVTSAAWRGLQPPHSDKPGVADACLEIARELRNLFPKELPQSVVLQVVGAKDLSGDVVRKGRVAEIFALLGDRKLRETLLKWLPDSGLPAAPRERAVLALLNTAPVAAEQIAAKDLFKTAQYSFALTLAVGLAGDKFGADLLLAAVKAGDAPARLLQEKAVLDRLKATAVADLDKKVADLTKGILPPDKRIEDLIKKRADGFRKGTFDAAKGQEVFKKSCAICHQLNNEGAKVGPQLDGVGIRGLDRLLEDTLDPNRNVDAAFKSTTLILSDGRSPTGLVREDGNTFVLIDGLGKENRFPKADVDKVVASNLSAMPANVDGTVSEADYYHLLAYLLQQRPK